MSSMVGLLIVTFVYRCITQQIGCQIHWAHNLFDEGNFVFGKIVATVEVGISPSSRPVLNRNEGVDFASDVLRGFVQQDQKAGQTTGQVRENTLCHIFSFEGADAKVGFRRYCSWTG